MKLSTYDKQEIIVTKEQAAKLAEAAELIEITTISGKIYVSPKNIASITQGGEAGQLKQLEAKVKE